VRHAHVDVAYPDLCGRSAATAPLKIQRKKNKEIKIKKEDI